MRLWWHAKAAWSWFMSFASLNRKINEHTTSTQGNRRSFSERCFERPEQHVHVSGLEQGH